MKKKINTHLGFILKFYKLSLYELFFNILIAIPLYVVSNYFYALKFLELRNISKFENIIILVVNGVFFL